MKRIYFSLLFLTVLVTTGYSQALDTIYRETFDNAPPYKVKSFGIPAWALDNTVPNTTLNYYRGQSTALTITPNYLELDSFNTINKWYVVLSFDHIGKLNFADEGSIEVSIDSGRTWNRVQTVGANSNSFYSGRATNWVNPLAAGTTGNIFNEGSYTGAPGQTVNWNPASPTATSNMWIRESIEISNLCSNAADVRVRFKIERKTPTPNRYGWLLDNIMVTRALSEIDPPVITHAPATTGYQYNTSFVLNAAMKDRTAISSAFVVFSVNGGAFNDSIPMSRINVTKNSSTGELTYNYRATLATPTFTDGDTVCYYITAFDSSRLRNYGYFPSPIPTCFQFVSSGPPILTHTPILGNQFSAGPFAINAVSRDASGIGSLTCFYTINNGPQQSLSLVKQGTTDNFTANLNVIDGDTVCYYLVSSDASPRSWTTRLPAASGCYSFIASGPPLVNYPSTRDSVLLITRFDLGPFDVFAYVRDGSGIQSVTLTYAINSGANVNVPMTLVSGNTYKGIIPAVNDSDEICYSVRAVDASVRNWATTAPLTGCRSFLALNGIRFPYTDGFDGGDIWLPVTVTPVNSAGWQRGVPNKTVLDNALSSPNCWVTALSGNYSGGARWYLESPVFDFSTAQDAELSFFQLRKINGGTTLPPSPSNGDAFYIEYTTDVNSANPMWVTLGSGNLSDPNIITNWYNKSAITSVGGPAGWNGNSNGWERSAYRLRVLNGVPKAKLRFVFRSNTVLHDEGVAIDNISIKLPLPNDAGVRNILAPIVETRGGLSTPITITIKNYGILPLTSVDVNYSINGGTTNTFSWTGNIPAGDTLDVVMPTFTAPNSYFTIDAWTTLNGDANTINDSSSRVVFGIPTKTVPYSDSFDGAVEEWISLGAPVNNRPVLNNEWEKGIPSGQQLNFALTPPNVWATNLRGNYSRSSISYLYSPYFDFSTAYNMKMSFFQNRRLVAGTILKVEYTTNFGVTWNQLGSLNDANGVNWFNGSINNGSVSEPGFTGSNSSYEESKYLLSRFDQSTQLVRFRFTLQSGASTLTGEGIALDNFSIQDPFAVDVGVVAVLAPLPTPPNKPILASQPVRVVVRNFGRDTVSAIPFNYSHAGIPQLNPSFVYTAKPLPPTKLDTVTLPNFPSTIVGLYQFCAYTAIVGDGNLSNDSICLQIEGLPNNEIQLLEVLNPRIDLCYEEGVHIISIRVRNNGHSPIANVVAHFKYDTITVTNVFNGVNIGRDSVKVLTFTTPITLPAGKTDVKIYADKFTQDRSVFDDTLRVRLNALEIFGIPYTNDFELGLNSINDFCTVEGKRNARIRVRRNVGKDSDFGLQMTAQTNTPGWSNSTSANIWNANRNADYLVSCKMKVASGSNPYIHIKFWENYYIGAAGGGSQAFVRVLINGVQQYANQGPGTGNPSNFRWTDINLNNKYNLGDTLEIEFQAKCALTNAVGIDSIVIYNELPLSASMTGISTFPPLPVSGNVTRVKAQVTNTGITPLNIVSASYIVNGATVQSNKLFAFVPPLQYFESELVEFNNTFTAIAGLNEICAWTELPNGATDIFANDDTICSIRNVSEVAVYPYCTDFDQGNDNWLTANSRTYLPSGNSFGLGDPQKGFLDTTYTGINSWVTAIGEYYQPNDSSALFTPFFEVVSDTCYSISFWHKYDIDPTGDGATLEYSTDGGVKWYAIGSIEPNWYTTSNIFSLIVRADTSNGGTPRLNGDGWTGNSTSWVQARRNFRLSTQADKVIFRFRFASDESNFLREYDGWAIDNFCFGYATANCLFVGQEEVVKNEMVVGAPYPNPTNGLTTIDFGIPQAGNVSYSISNVIGQKIVSENLGKVIAGNHKLNLNLDQFNAGIYFYTLEYNGERITKKIIVTK